MADGRSSGSGERRVYRVGSTAPSQGAGAKGSGGGGDSPERQGARRPRRSRIRRPWWQRLLLALVVVLAVAAVSFLIGYLIGLKLAGVVIIGV